MDCTERQIEFKPAFDKRNSDPSKNYGIHGLEIIFLLKKEKATMQFQIYTNWHLPNVQKWLNKKAVGEKLSYIGALFNPMGADVGCHSKQPMYKGQEPTTQNCKYTDGICYYDGSSLQARELLERFITEGEEIVWATLEKRYQLWIEERKSTMTCKDKTKEMNMNFIGNSQCLSSPHNTTKP